MKVRSHQRKFIVAAVAAALTLGLTGGAWAQQPSDATGGTTTGGTTTDTTSAGNTNGGGMPQIQHQGDIAYVSGGVGIDESHALERARSQWPLALSFIGPGSDYLADVQVQVTDAHDGEVFQATSRGPYMLVRLRPGQYTVHASYKSEEQRKTVTVPAQGNARTSFYWKTQ